MFWTKLWAQCNLLSLSLVLCIALPGCASTQEASPSPTISFDRAVQFSAPDGSDVIIGPGVYRVEAVEATGLRLIPDEGKNALAIQATASRHLEQLAEPAALSIPVNESQHHVVLLLPGGQSLDAVGSPSGVRERGLLPNPLTPSQLQQAAAAQLYPQLEMQKVIRPPVPALQLPADNEMITDGIVTFKWVEPSGYPKPDFYKICVREENQTCDSPTASVYVFSGIPAVITPGSPTGGPTITGPTVYTPPRGLPTTFQGKTLRWNVMACANLLGAQPKCTSSPDRQLIWFIPGLNAPFLINPVDGASGNYQPTFSWYGVEGATSYKLCVTLRTVANCGLQAGETPDTVVLDVRARPGPTNTLQQATLPHGLVPFDGRTVHWTVATCRAAECWYQQQARGIRVVPAAPTLVSPASDTVLPRGSVTFSWQAVQGASFYKLCLFRLGATCISNVDYHGTDTSVSLALSRHFWDNAEGGVAYQWGASACAANGICTASTPRPITFQVPPDSFYWLYPVFQNSKCTNCHGMDSHNAKYQQHINEGRFQPETYLYDSRVCVNCHRANSGFVDNWRAPGVSDFTGLSVSDTCIKILYPGGRPRNIVGYEQVWLLNRTKEHLEQEPLLLWSIHRIPGVTMAQWMARVDSWVAGGLRDTDRIPCPSNPVQE